MITIHEKIITALSVALGVAILALFLSVKSCSYHATNEAGLKSANDAITDTLHHTVDVLTGKAETYKKAANETQAQLDASLSEKASLKAQLKGFSKVNAYAEQITATRIDTITVTLHDTAPCQFKDIYFNIDSPYYHIPGHFNNKSITFTGISFPDSCTLIIGTHRNGIFKADDYRVSVEHSNKMIQVTGLNATTVSVPTKRFGLGISAGVGFNGSLIPTPSVQVGVQWSLIRW